MHQEATVCQSKRSQEEEEGSSQIVMVAVAVQSLTNSVFLET
jgi:hypothetical protein